MPSQKMQSCSPQPRVSLSTGRISPRLATTSFTMRWQADHAYTPQRHRASVQVKLQRCSLCARVPVCPCAFVCPTGPGTPNRRFLLQEAWFAACVPVVLQECQIVLSASSEGWFFAPAFLTNTGTRSISPLFSREKCVPRPLGTQRHTGSQMAGFPPHSLTAAHTLAS